MSEEIKAKIEEKVLDRYKRTDGPIATIYRYGAEFGYQLAQEDQPNQDELWEEFWRNCVESDRGQEYFDYEEAKKRYRITRVK